MVEAQNSIFDKSNFNESLILHSDFSGASFKGADLSKAVVADTIFAKCDLRGANLSCAGLETCVLDGAVYDELTIWNENFNVAEYRVIKFG